MLSLSLTAVDIAGVQDVDLETESETDSRVEKKAKEGALAVTEHSGLTVMTFNVWNTNPPSW